MAPDSSRVLRGLLADALKRRRPLIDDPDITAFRAFHGRADGRAGLFVDVYGPGAVMIRYDDAEIDPSAAGDVLSALKGIGVVGVYDKPFVRDRSCGGGQDAEVLTNPKPTAGESVDEVLLVTEPAERFEVRLYDGFSTGLFLDQRENRQRARELCTQMQSPRVLNLFAYTGAFSVACTLGGGGGAEVSTVDVSSRYLDWAKRNFAHNGIDPNAHHFAKMDAREFVDMVARRGWTFDLVIVDPPTFGAADKRRGVPSWSSTRDYPGLLRNIRRIVAPDGAILASTNTAALCEGDVLARMVEDALGDGFSKSAPSVRQVDFPAGETCSATGWWQKD